MTDNRNGVPFELEDYIAVKKYAYEWVMNGGSTELKDIHDLITENLDLPLDWLESQIIISTILFPFDGGFCKRYKQSIENNNNMFYLDESFANPNANKGNIAGISHKCLETKLMEINEFGLDKLIENGELNPPMAPEMAPNAPRK